MATPEVMALAPVALGGARSQALDVRFDVLELLSDLACTRLERLEAGHLVSVISLAA
jgi:hypothetical protein